jgi:hypothetical protein
MDKKISEEYSQFWQEMGMLEVLSPISSPPPKPTTEPIKEAAVLAPNLPQPSPEELIEQFMPLIEIERKHALLENPPNVPTVSAQSDESPPTPSPILSEAKPTIEHTPVFTKPVLIEDEVEMDTLFQSLTSEPVLSSEPVISQISNNEINSKGRKYDDIKYHYIEQTNDVGILHFVPSPKEIKPEPVTGPVQIPPTASPNDTNSNTTMSLQPKKVEQNLFLSTDLAAENLNAIDDYLFNWLDLEGKPIKNVSSKNQPNIEVPIGQKPIPNVSNFKTANETRTQVDEIQHVDLNMQEQPTADPVLLTPEPLPIAQPPQKPRQPFTFVPGQHTSHPHPDRDRQSKPSNVSSSSLPPKRQAEPFHGRTLPQSIMNFSDVGMTDPFGLEDEMIETSDKKQWWKSLKENPIILASALAVGIICIYAALFTIRFTNTEFSPIDWRNVRMSITGETSEEITDNSSTSSTYVGTNYRFPARDQDWTFQDWVRCGCPICKRYIKNYLNDRARLEQLSKKEDEKDQSATPTNTKKEFKVGGHVDPFGTEQTSGAAGTGQTVGASSSFKPGGNVF